MFGESLMTRVISDQVSHTALCLWHHPLPNFAPKQCAKRFTMPSSSMCHQCAKENSSTSCSYSQVAKIFIWPNWDLCSSRCLPFWENLAGTSQWHIFKSTDHRIINYMHCTLLQCGNLTVRHLALHLNTVSLQINENFGIDHNLPITL